MLLLLLVPPPPQPLYHRHVTCAAVPNGPRCTGGTPILGFFYYNFFGG